MSLIKRSKKEPSTQEIIQQSKKEFIDELIKILHDPKCDIREELLDVTRVYRPHKHKDNCNSTEINNEGLKEYNLNVFAGSYIQDGTKIESVYNVYLRDKKDKKNLVFTVAKVHSDRSPVLERIEYLFHAQKVWNRTMFAEGGLEVDRDQKNIAKLHQWVKEIYDTEDDRDRAKRRSEESVGKVKDLKESIRKAKSKLTLKESINKFRERTYARIHKRRLKTKDERQG